MSVLSGSGAKNSASQAGSDLPEDVRSQLPRHVAIIMDGNGRWAQSRQWRRVLGHKEGANRVREVVEASAQWGLEALTLFAFSEENWQRPSAEVAFLMELLNRYIVKEAHTLAENNVQLRVIGNLQRLPARSQQLIRQTVDQLSTNTGLTLTLALSYSGRSEIVTACQRIAAAVAEGSLTIDEIDAKAVESQLGTAALPDPDLLIRTSGEQRVSNFLLWQLAYAELYFCDTYWPDFTREEFKKALMAYSARERRFGRVNGNAVPRLSKGINGSTVSNEITGSLC